MSSVNLSRFQFNGGENAAPIENLASLPREDQERLVLAGIDVNDNTASGAFMAAYCKGHCRQILSQGQGVAFFGRCLQPF